MGEKEEKKEKKRERRAAFVSKFERRRNASYVDVTYTGGHSLRELCAPLAYRLSRNQSSVVHR